MLAAEGIKTNSVVAIFSAHKVAEAAVQELEMSGYNMKQLSIVGRDYYGEDNVVGCYSTGDRVKNWGKIGVLCGGLWGLLFGTALFVVPGLGPVVAGGPIVMWIISALESAALIGSMGVIGAALYSIGVPHESVKKYETCLKANYVIVVAHGTPFEIDKACSILQGSNPLDMDVHWEVCVST